MSRSKPKGGLYVKRESVNDKTKELMLYIATKLEHKDHAGSTLFNKILYFVDSTNYAKNGKSISNFKYIKQQFGPTPKPAQFMPAKEELLESGATTEQERDYFGKVVKKLIPTREANLELFKKQEIALIDQIISEVCSYSATQISDLTHTHLNWIIAKNGEELPLHTFLLTSQSPSEKSVAWAHRIINEIENVL